MSATAPVRGSSTKPAGRPEKPLPATLREIRHSKGWTLARAAHGAGINAARLSELERGLRPPSSVEFVALEDLYMRRLRIVVQIVEDVQS